jgi:hypothetical protein
VPPLLRRACDVPQLAPWCEVPECAGKLQPCGEHKIEFLLVDDDDC